MHKSKLAGFIIDFHIDEAGGYFARYAERRVH